MTYSETCLIALEAEGVETGFVQYYVGKEGVRLPKTGGEDFGHGSKIVKKFRVVICNGKKTEERTGPDLLATLREVFTLLALALPDKLKK